MHVSAQTQKIKKNPSRENFLWFRKWNALGLILKKVTLFLQKKAFLIFPQTEPCTFHGGSKKLIFQEVTVRVRKSKIFYTFRYKEVKFSTLKYFFVIKMKRFFSFYNNVAMHRDLLKTLLNYVEYNKKSIKLSVKPDISHCKIHAIWRNEKITQRID